MYTGLTIVQEIQATDVTNISETSDNIRLWNVGAKRKHKIQINPYPSNVENMVSS